MSTGAGGGGAIGVAVSCAIASTSTCVRDCADPGGRSRPNGAIAIGACGAAGIPGLNGPPPVGVGGRCGGGRCGGGRCGGGRCGGGRCGGGATNLTEAAASGLPAESMGAMVCEGPPAEGSCPPELSGPCEEFARSPRPACPTPTSNPLSRIHVRTLVSMPSRRSTSCVTDATVSTAIQLASEAAALHADWTRRIAADFSSGDPSDARMSSICLCPSWAIDLNRLLRRSTASALELNDLALV